MSLKQEVVASPCIRNCCLDHNDICLGCFRSIEEIISWTQVDEQTRRCFLNNVGERQKAYQQG
ncbi:MAG: DUF1289 domain-containing protein [Methylococcaceae bacterium]